MIDESVIRELIKNAVNEIDLIDTRDFSLGKVHHYLSKAFVANVGRYFKSRYHDDSFQTRFQDFQNGKGVSGEWLFDVVIVRLKSTEEESSVRYTSDVLIAIESELHEGKKAFIDDFSKLLVVNAAHKIYINGIGRAKQKDIYITKRLGLIKSILQDQKDRSTYTICFVDKPRCWKNEEIFVSIYDVGI